MNRITEKISIGLFLVAMVLVSWKSNDTIQSESKSVQRGKSVYTKNCTVCHMANGEGISKVFPPLAKSDYLMEDLSRAGGIILNGKKGAIEVNGVTYKGMMAGFSLSDQELADVVNYISNSWGNTSKEVDVKWASELRKSVQ